MKNSERSVRSEKPYAGNPHVWFDEGKVASEATQRRGALRYKISVDGVTRVCVAICIILAGNVMYGQSREQRAKATEFKCSFQGRCQTAKGGDRHTSDYGVLGYSKSKSRSLDCLYTLRLNSKQTETFTVETYFMAKQDKRTFPFAKNEVEVTLTRGFTTNIDVTSPELTMVKRKIMSGSGRTGCCPASGFYTYSYSEEGSTVAGAFARLKKDGVIIKTWCSMAPWAKMAWNPKIDIIAPKDRSKDSDPFFGTPPVLPAPENGTVHKQ